MLPALAAYMGHVKWSWTEQYLSATPERFWKQLSHLGLVPAPREQSKISQVDQPYSLESPT
jgi:hypothetical protein